MTAEIDNDIIQFTYGKVVDKYGQVDYVPVTNKWSHIRHEDYKPMADGQYEIPEGWEEVHIVFKEVPIGSNVKDFREMKIEKEGKLIHHFIYITNFKEIKIFDKATGRMYDNNECEVKL